MAWKGRTQTGLVCVSSIEDYHADVIKKHEFTKSGHTLIQVIDSAGRVIKTVLEKDYTVAGTFTVPFDSYNLPVGVYYARLQNGPIQQVRAMLKVR
jgi:hypothetical protein